GYSNVDSALAGINNNVTTPPPAPPTWQTPTVVSSIQINLAWTESTAGVDGFFIERRTGPVGTFTQIKQLPGPAASYPDTGLSPGTPYYYQMRAFSNQYGISNYSAVINASTLSTPAPPSNLTAAAPTAAQINLTWVDGSSNEDGFAVERAAGAGAYAQIATVAANLTSYQDTDPALLPATPYNYRVRAFSNAAGYSAYCMPATVTTPN